jgi:hypothetical protein
MSKQRRKPQEILIIGAILMVASFAAYFYIGHAEQAGGTIVLPVLLMPVYNLLGKMGIVGVLFVVGAVTVARGAVKMRTSAQLDKLQAAREARQAQEAQQAAQSQAVEAAGAAQ